MEFKAPAIMDALDKVISDSALVPERREALKLVRELILLQQRHINSQSLTIQDLEAILHDIRRNISNL